MRRTDASVACISCLAIAAPVSASVLWDVRFDQSAPRDGLDTTLIRDNLVAAANEWTNHLDTIPGVTIDVIIRFDTTIPRAGGRSVTSSFVRNNGEFNVYEQALATELRTGYDPNATTPDVEIFLNPDYALNTLWFDPDPFDHAADIPSTRVDAYSIFLHELGHALAFNGWRAQHTGALPDYASTFDELTAVDPSGYMFFVGQEAMRVYGDRVPLTWGNNFHLANAIGYPGDDLIEDLMNGVFFRRGERYDISLLDLAIAYDSGVSVNPDALIPAPSAIALIPLTLITGARRTRRD